MKKSLLICFVFALIFSCKSIPENIPEDLSSAQLFKLAQSEVISKNYKAAEVYYNTILERFSEDPESFVVAKYELAFIHYKDDKKVLAEKEFKILIDMFSTEESASYPKWILVLSKKILNQIQNPKAKKSKKDPTEN